jgi:hypothetical protein
MRAAAQDVRPTVGHEEAPAVAAGVNAVRPDAGRDEPDPLQTVGLDNEDAVGLHVGDEEDAAIG